MITGKKQLGLTKIGMVKWYTEVKFFATISILQTACRTFELYLNQSTIGPVLLTWVLMTC